MTRDACVFSCTDRLCEAMDRAGVPPDPVWRSLILYLRSVGDLDYLSPQQRRDLQGLLLAAIHDRDFSAHRLDETLRRHEQIFTAPYRERLEQAVQESARMLREFLAMMACRRGDVQGLGERVVSAVAVEQDPVRLVAGMRQAFAEVVAIMDQDLAKLTRLSQTDALTGLHNRRAFDDFLARAMTAATQNNSSVALLFLDIDHFKGFNDRFGHRVGDQALVTVAKIMRQGGEAFYARYGGEEFAVVLPGAGLAAALEHAEALRRRIAGYELVIRDSRGAIVQKGIAITASIGVATWSAATGLEAGELVEAADRALYAAKAGGRNRVVGPDAAS
ncbi:MAG: GGDEF domain-containing protein [Thermodesulfobacteriota bacterium]